MSFRPLLTRPVLARSVLAHPSINATRGLARMTIVGRLAGEPELIPTASGQDILRYSLATSNGPRADKKTSWWKVVYFTRSDGDAKKDVLLSLGKG